VEGHKVESFIARFAQHYRSVFVTPQEGQSRVLAMQCAWRYLGEETFQDVMMAQKPTARSAVVQPPVT
jgi:hypothetical protein